MFERILIAIDGSEDARRARDLGFRLAARLGSRVTLLHVVDVRLIEGPAIQTLAPLWGEVSARPFQPEVLRTYRERGAKLLDEAADTAREAGCAEIETRLEVGVADEVILADALSPDLLVLGRRGEHAGFGDEAMGSTLARVLRRSPHPVLAGDAASGAREGAGRAGTGREDDTGSVSRGAAAAERPAALVAYDAHQASVHALDLAIRYAEAIGCELRLVHAGGEANEEIVDAAIGVLKDHDVPWEAARIDADPAAAVEEALVRWEADCLFMGRFGGGRLRDLVFGSHTQRIFEAAAVPIFLTR